MGTGRTQWAVCLLAALLSSLPLAASAVELTLLAQPGPWSGVSRLIGYRGRVWFANSVKHVNHNSADLYSYDPRTGATRYETRLFSQDAGVPLIADGLLYWPFEDSRASAGRGEYMVTDGERWRWHALPSLLAFHLHAMASLDSRLYAATSAWQAGLQVSSDGGHTWRAVHRHPTPSGRVTRFVSLAVLDRSLYVGMSSRVDEGPRLLRLADGVLTPVEGWPSARITTDLEVYRGWLYATSRDDATTRVWRTDGTRVEEVSALAGRSVRALAAGPESL